MSNKIDGTLGTECGETEWKHAVSVVKNQWHHLHTSYWLSPKLDLFLESPEGKKHSS